MQQLADAGIYVISDLGQPNLSINRDNPEWNVELYQRYTNVIDALSKYQNVMGFFAGNEVSDSLNTTAASAFVKAAVRDSKAYIAAQHYHPMGVGYATYDGPIRSQLAEVRTRVLRFILCPTDQCFSTSTAATKPRPSTSGGTMCIRGAATLLSKSLGTPSASPSSRTTLSPYFSPNTGATKCSRAVSMTCLYFLGLKWKTLSQEASCICISKRYIVEQLAQDRTSDTDM